MKTHTVPIITNGPLCGEACPWLVESNNNNPPACLVFGEWLKTRPLLGLEVAVRCDDCRHVTERAEALP